MKGLNKKANKQELQFAVPHEAYHNAMMDKIRALGKLLQQKHQENNRREAWRTNGYGRRW